MKIDGKLLVATHLHQSNYVANHQQVLGVHHTVSASCLCTKTKQGQNHSGRRSLQRCSQLLEYKRLGFRVQEGRRLRLSPFFLPFFLWPTSFVEHEEQGEAEADRSNRCLLQRRRKRSQLHNRQRSEKQEVQNQDSLVGSRQLVQTIDCSVKDKKNLQKQAQSLSSTALEHRQASTQEGTLGQGLASNDALASGIQRPRKWTEFFLKGHFERGNQSTKGLTQGGFF